MLKTAWILSVLFLLGACSHMAVQKTATSAPPTRELRANFLLFGLINPPAMNYSGELCPGGTLERMDYRTTAGDAIVSILTLGLYTPQQLALYCKPKASPN